MLKKIITSTTKNAREFVEKSPIHVSQEDLILIVEEASTLTERIGTKFISDTSESDKNLINFRLEKWCQISTKGDRELFSQRLAWDGLNLNTVRQALGKVSLIDKQSLPSWTDTLKKAMETTSLLLQDIFSTDKTQKFSYLYPKDPIPFEEIFVPFIEVAKKKLIVYAGSSYQLLSADAHIELERRLLKKMMKIFLPSLSLEFSMFLSCRGLGLFRTIKKLENNQSNKQYLKFINNLLSDGLLSFFQEYSVLARLAAVSIDFWVESVGEFLHRLESDWEQIQSTFGKDKELEQVVSILSDVSDSHNNGRSVFIITFASELKLVYKPKNLSLEQAYLEFLDWINQKQTLLPLKVLQLLNCNSYGWIEFVEPLPCDNQQAVRHYYQRAGILLCIIYALSGTDFHKENLIACGEQPVLIDLEALFHYCLDNKEIDDALLQADYQWRTSVLMVGLLPGVSVTLINQNQEEDIDVSALGSFNEQDKIIIPELKWYCVNTDSMTIVEEKLQICDSSFFKRSQKNGISGKGLQLSSSSHTKELITGFQQMYQFLLKNRQTLLASDGPIAKFAGQKVRILLRNTQLYSSILKNSLNPKCLRNGVNRSIELDILSRALLSWEEKHPAWDMLASEKKAIEQLDIPYANIYSDNRVIVINSDTTIEEFLEFPSYDRVIKRLQQLDDINLAQQISVIQSSFYSTHNYKQLSLLNLPNIIPKADEITILTKETILDQAIAIAEELKHKAIYGGNDSIAWNGISYNFDTHKFEMKTIDYSLYDGFCGISVFLAALVSVTGNAEYKKFALGAVQTLRCGLKEEDPEYPQLKSILMKKMGMGGSRGLASIVYSFTRIAEFLGEAEILKDAQQIASWLKVDTLEVEEEPGILRGTAATILSLVALYKATSDDDILEQAINWGKYLIDKSIITKTGCRLWTNLKGQPLTGFSHGVDGIAYALLQLYSISQDSAFLQARKEAIASLQETTSMRNPLGVMALSGYNSTIAYNVNLNSEVTNNTTESPLASWCYDLPGTMLAHLGSLSILREENIEDIQQELEIALQKLQNSNLQASNLQPLDNLCCGNFADLEVLLVAARELARPELLEIAHQKISLVFHRANQMGSLQLLPYLPNEVYHPSFAQGTTGIGYGLLRLLYPNKLPSVLLWQ